MDKMVFSTIEAECGCVSEFVDLLLKKNCYNISIKPINEGFEVEFATTNEGRFEFLKSNEIKVHSVELPNGDIVWSENEEEDKLILERWNKMTE